MQYIKSYLVIFISVISLHYYLFVNTEIDNKRVYASTQVKKSTMKLHKVHLKKKIPKKVTKKVVKKVPKKKKPLKKKKILKSKPIVKPKEVIEPEAVVVEVIPQPEEKIVEVAVVEDIVEPTPINLDEIKIIEEEYLQHVRLLIQKNKFYPKRAKRFKQTGKVLVAFTINKDGSFCDVRVLEDSRYKLLNSAALDIFQRIAHFEVIPEKLKDKKIWEITIPISYTITQG